MTEDSGEAAFHGVGPALDLDAEADAGRLASERSRLPQVVEAVEDDRVVVTAAAFDDEALEPDVRRPRGQAPCRCRRPAVTEDRPDPRPLLGWAHRLLGDARRRQRRRGALG